ncbi:MAG: zinc-binding dehydrogenase, partial [Chloroflexota bacterium]|nr:zinc-binding dehydrogenase [Chloroflexota bacterium]
RTVFFCVRFRVDWQTKMDFSEEAMRITGGKGVNVVYDAVGADTFEKGLACLAPRGVMALYGQASGPVPTLTLALLNPKSLFVTRPTLNSYTATREELEWRAGDVLGWVKSGELSVKVHGRFPLSDAAEAHRQLQGRLTTGKLLLIP